MELEFDFANVVVTEFGVGRDEADGASFVAVPVGADVQAALREIVQATWDALQEEADEPSRYEPSEKYGSTEWLYLPIEDELAAWIRQLYDAANLEVDAGALSDPADIFCYFARLVDNRRRRLTALRRATQFKGVLKSRNRLVRMLDDTLTVIEDTVFKLDNDFDLLVDADNVHILRPSGFEFAGKLQDAILAAVPINIQALQQALPFVAFDAIAEYAGGHPRAARYLASIRARVDIENVDKMLLTQLCQQTGVEVGESNGVLGIASGHELGFLEVLDRRRYEVTLISDTSELYRASSRKKISG